MRSLVAASFISALLLSLIPASLLADDAPNWMQRPGTIQNALTLSDGSHVYLDAMEVDKIRSQDSTPYFTVRECFSTEDRIVVLAAPSPLLRLGQTVDVEGDLTTLDNGCRALVDPTVYGYTDSLGILTYDPIMKGLMEPTPWQWKADLTAPSPDMSVSPPSVGRPVPPPLGRRLEGGLPDTSPADAPVYYPSIPDMLAGDNAQPQTARLNTMDNSIPDLNGLPDGSLVELSCKRIVGVGTETIDGVDYAYIDVAEDLPSEDTIRAYYTQGVPDTDRIVQIDGQLRYIDDVPAICVDSGPNDDPQVYEGYLIAAAPGTISYAKTLADGASATLQDKIVTGNQSDQPGCIIVQEPEGFAAIPVCYSGSFVPNVGNTVEVTGTMSTAADGAREILAAVDGVNSPTLPQALQWKGPYAMRNKAVPRAAAFENPLSTSHLFVRTWGAVTAVDSANGYFYIDDGSNLADGTGNTGLRVLWPWPTVMPPAIGWQVVATAANSTTLHSAYKGLLANNGAFDDPQQDGEGSCTYPFDNLKARILADCQ